MKRTLVFSALMLAATLVLVPGRTRADEITVKGTTASITPAGIAFTAPPFGFSGTTSGGYAGFSNLGLYTLSSNPATYTGAPVNLQITFSLPAGINGGPTENFTANVWGNVLSLANGGVSINFTNPSQNFTFSAPNGNHGSFTFTVYSLGLSPGGTTALSGFVSNGSMTVPEPSSGLLLGTGLLLTPFLKLRRLS